MELRDKAPVVPASILLSPGAAGMPARGLPNRRGRPAASHFADPRSVGCRSDDPNQAMLPLGKHDAGVTTPVAGERSGRHPIACATAPPEGTPRPFGCNEPGRFHEAVPVAETNRRAQAADFSRLIVTAH